MILKSINLRCRWIEANFQFFPMHNAYLMRNVITIVRFYGFEQAQLNMGWQKFYDTTE
jgi:DNA phosphorothioation-dependent restriction protein DptG